MGDPLRTSAAPLPAIVLCGGEGSRLGGDVEKPLVEVAGEPMIDRVLDGLRTADRVGRIHAVTSPKAPETHAHLLENRVAGEDELVVHEGAGGGYVADLNDALERTGTPALTVAADLPLLSGEAVDLAVERAAGESLSVCVPRTLKQELGVSADTTFDHDGTTVAPTGMNVVGSEADRVHVVDSKALAVNVNRPGDLAVARALAGDDGD
ncbi:NTP transferase domain-containing protein [Haloparvum sp. PAK95]|uniref:NTP transferase domain-containing protein n=1 Tax=Haloparvum sp. PAK95 TaxID=3418962 RepID=UPI003D2F23AC